ncbi:replication initiation protein [Oceaniovalibus guishaninsula]|nr:replication initiation protein [Oceaniovalibus guishaninsula]
MTETETAARPVGDIPRDRLTGALRRGSVKKHVAAIHVSGRLTLLQRKLSNVLLLNAYDGLGRQPTFEIDAQTLCLMIGYNSNDNETLKASLRGLVETVAEWDMLDEAGRQEWGVSSLLSFATLKAGVCRYAYSPALAEKLRDPKVFALIDLNIQRRFTSGHALALYENCYRFVRTGSTGWWPLETFRRLMGVADSAYYETFKHLNAKIVKPAVAEVNRTSNIVVTPHTRKRGRVVTDIRFAIERNAQLAMLDMDDGAGLRHSPVHARLVAMGIADRLARQWLVDLGEAAVAARLDYVAGQGDVRHPARYLSAVMAGEAVKGQGGAPAAAAPVAGASGAGLSARARMLERIQKNVAARSPTQRDADKRLFAGRIGDASARDDFDRNGWMSALNHAAIVAFWEEMRPGSMAEAG